MNGMSIEWRHYDKAGATCERCAATGKSVSEVVAELSDELAEGKSYEEIPEELIRKAAYKAIGLNDR